MKARFGCAAVPIPILLFKLLALSPTGAEVRCVHTPPLPPSTVTIEEVVSDVSRRELKKAKKAKRAEKRAQKWAAEARKVGDDDVDMSEKKEIKSKKKIRPRLERPRLPRCSKTKKVAAQSPKLITIATAEEGDDRANKTAGDMLKNFREQSRRRLEGSRRPEGLTNPLLIFINNINILLLIFA